MNHPALPAIESAIRQLAGNRFRIRSAHSSGNGPSLTVADGSAKYFVKLGAIDRLPMFEAEIDGLLALASTGCFRTPAPIACGSGEDSGEAFLVLEHLELHPLQSAEHGIRFADALVALHQTTGPRFGWRCDNFIGGTPQHNAWADNWALFFTEHRLRPQFALARSKGFSGELQKQGERLFDRVPALFLDYRPRESLLHGDLWHGNAAVLADGTPAIFDPATHYGDRESDIAMSELFGGFPGSFYARYRAGWALDEGYEARKLLYGLYHMLNHLNLFGRGYLGEALRLATRLNAALSMWNH
ncbi:fructosamine kinase family protein [Thauera linaloolentis]|uniref:Fructosamine kinase n=1 Tax=Thauera linaloolentis (strain DSM 12138 / JCM 21573 / CCUG 41526 / CIP 105981 / IAM 15112 / NBRC 102519 / 47Lol) TaxID=1123367 RepID=N6Z722_THAL4|nr:fructosamine kinase family protein [Thauera linaloolentis]ENO90347.1 fructosamine kinase [Thauera linaloolentis 47Lol = DSM 12138]MCM8564079.1 fructosamine kinase family protein [Thauera linaloolentis]